MHHANVQQRTGVCEPRRTRQVLGELRDLVGLSDVSSLNLAHEGRSCGGRPRAGRSGPFIGGSGTLVPASNSPEFRQVTASDPTSVRSTQLRRFYAELVVRRGGAKDPRIRDAFACVPREPFAGPGPWSVFGGGPGTRSTGYVRTPSDDPAFLYQDTLIALDAARGINIGEPSLHARCLDALALQPGERVLHVGAGAGYYTALLAKLVGPTGYVEAYEIDPALAARAERNLRIFPTITVRARSGVADDLPQADAIYVNAGITQPERAWLDALRLDGRLLFPLQPEGGFGGMLLVRRPCDGGAVWPASFLSRAGFIGCHGPQLKGAGQALKTAFAAGGWEAVKSLRFTPDVDSSCWVAGEGWWLSTDPALEAGRHR